MKIDELFDLPIHEMKEWMDKHYQNAQGYTRDEFCYYELEGTFPIEIPKDSGWRTVPVFSTYWSGNDVGCYNARTPLEYIKYYGQTLRFAITKISKYGECLTIELSGNLNRQNVFHLTNIRFNDTHSGYSSVYLDGADVVNNSRIAVYYEEGKTSTESWQSEKWIDKFDFLDKYPHTVYFDKPILSAISKNKHSINEYVNKLEKYAKKVQEIGKPMYDKNKELLNNNEFRNKCFKATTATNKKRLVSPEQVLDIWLACYMKNQNVTIEDAIGMVQLSCSSQHKVIEYREACKVKEISEYCGLTGYETYSPYHLSLLYGKTNEVQVPDFFFGYLKDLDATKELYQTMGDYKQTVANAKEEYKNKFLELATKFETDIVDAFKQIEEDINEAKNEYITASDKLYEEIHTKYKGVNDSDVNIHMTDKEIINDLIKSFETTAAKLKKLADRDYKISLSDLIAKEKKEEEDTTAELLEHCKKYFDAAPNAKKLVYYQVSKSYDAPYEVYECTDNIIEDMPEEDIFDYEEVYGVGSFEEWFDTFMSLTPYESKWEKQYGNDLYPEQKYQKYITRDLKFNEGTDDE